MKQSRAHILLACLLAVCMACLVGCFDLFGDGKAHFYVDGQLYETVTPAEDGSISIPTVSQKDGYTFDGWYADEAGKQPYRNQGDAYGFMRPISYNITYDLDGGVGDNPTFYTIETQTFTLSAPEKSGYTFVGWTTDGQSTPQRIFTVSKGTKGDISLQAHYTPTVFTITYDLGGGTADNPASYTVESPSFTLTPPTRAGNTFFAWEKDGVLYDSYTVEQGSIGDITLRAVWDTGLPMLSYKADIGGATVTSDTPAGGVERDARVTVTAPSVVGDKVFLCWTSNGKMLSYAASYTFTMGDKSRALVACYEDMPVTVYDKANRRDLAITLDTAVTPFAIYGASVGNLTDVVFERGCVTLSANCLASLSCGVYTFFIDDTSGGAWFSLRVTDSRTPTSVSVVYDTVSFPAVVLTFDCSCGGEHTYTLDNGNPTLCKSGDILSGYDKTKDHAVKVTCVTSGNYTTATRTGYTAALAEYYTTTFTYGGCVYDFAIESEAECAALYEYLIAVRGVLDYIAGESELKYDFYFGDEMAEVIYDTDAYETLMSRVFGAKSFPMSPSVQLSYSQSTPCVCSLAVSYPDGLHPQVSSQQTSTVTKMSNLEKTNGRPSSFNAFAIDACPSVEVRTLYELELLPYGLRPVFKDDNSDAAVVYEAARDILRSIIDDSMNDYQKVTAIYYYLACTVTYDTVAFTSSHGAVYRSFTSYGALIDKLAVCDGYASAFRLLCHIEGIPCEEYSGRTDPADPASGHAWNKYIIDGVTYACDVTWARVSDEYVTMRYLMMDEAALLDSGHYENAAADNFFTERCADGMFDYYDRIGTTDGYDLRVDSYEELEAAVALGLQAELGYIEVYMQENETTLRSYLTMLYKSFGRSFSLVTLSEQTVCIILAP